MKNTIERKEIERKTKEKKKRRGGPEIFLKSEPVKKNEENSYNFKKKNYLFS